MKTPAAPSATPWHKRVLGWLGVGLSEAEELQRRPDPGERFPWEPVLPAPRPPQWGAADRPELLLGQADGAMEDEAALP